MTGEDFQTINPRLSLSRPDPQDRNAESVDRLINAVICLLIERGAPLIAEALTPDNVTKRAGKSRASYYRTEGFPASDASSQDPRLEVLEEAIAHALRYSANDTAQVVGGIASYIEAGWVSDSPSEFISTMVEDNFDSVADFTSTIQLLAGALAPSSTNVEESLREYYERVTAAYSASYEELFRFWGYRPRAPLTTERFTMVIMALAEGLILRHYGNAGIDRDLYADLLSAVGSVLLVADGDVPTYALPVTHDLPGDVPPPTRGSIISTLVRMFETERGTLPTIEELAAAVGCSVKTIRTHFGGVPGVIRAAWSEWIPEFEETAERTRASLRAADPVTVLYRVALGIAARAGEHLPLTRALLMSELGVDATARSMRDEPVTSLFEQLLREALNARAFRLPAVNNPVLGEEDTWMFARTLRNNIMTTVVTHQTPAGADDADHARWCVDYVWAALFPPRDASA